MDERSLQFYVSVFPFKFLNCNNWKDCPCPSLIEYPWQLCQKSTDHRFPIPGFFSGFSITFQLLGGGFLSHLLSFACCLWLCVCQCHAILVTIAFSIIWNKVVLIPPALLTLPWVLLAIGSLFRNSFPFMSRMSFLFY